jgi:hypothetical protein
MPSSPLAVCVLPEPPPNRARTVGYPHYIHEILAHAGLCYERVAFEELGERLDSLRLLVTLGEQQMDTALTRRLADWVRRGGGWLSIGGLCGQQKLLGAQYVAPPFALWVTGPGTLGEGYMDVRADDPALAHAPRPLHFFHGIAVEAREAQVRATSLDAHHRPTQPRPVFLERRIARGRCLLLAADVTGTIVRIQQGVGVTRDGVAAPDGTAPINDGVLKSDDGGVLDWLLDREPVPGVPGLRAFLQPVADQWRELVLRALFDLATTQRVPLPSRPGAVAPPPGAVAPRPRAAAPSARKEA